MLFGKQVNPFVLIIYACIDLFFVNGYFKQENQYLDMTNEVAGWYSNNNKLCNVFKAQKKEDIRN